MTFRLLFTIGLMLLLYNTGFSAHSLPPAKEVLAKMELANNYFMKKSKPCSNCLTGKRPSNIWTRATYFEGLMAMYAITKDKILYDYAVTWGSFHKWGLRKGTSSRNADNQCCGQVYLELYAYEQKSERIKDIAENIDNMMNTTKIDDWTWIDAIHMAMPVFAKLGVIKNDTKYFDRMHDMYTYTKSKLGESGLYNPEDKLWWRDVAFTPPKKAPNGEDIYWSRGNGWVIAALVRVLDVLPDNDPRRKEYIQMVRDMAEALLAVQRLDGFWNESLHDPNHFGGKETSGTAFFTYAFSWGINNGILDKNTYLPAIINAWNGMSEKALHRDNSSGREAGFLGYVQGTGAKPGDFGKSRNIVPSYTREPDFDDYGLGAFLLAGAEVYKLAATTEVPLSQIHDHAFQKKSCTSVTSFPKFTPVLVYDFKGRTLEVNNWSHRGRNISMSNVIVIIP